jgi:hypothetical protein
LPGRFAEVHVRVCEEPIGQFSPPFGEVTVIVGCTRLKFALLLSRIVGSDTLRVLTLAIVDTGPATIHGSEPSFVVPANSVVGNVVPPSVERSIFTFPLTPLDVHVIVWEDPIAQDSLPFGDVTVSVGPPATIVKLTFETSKKMLPTASTFIRAAVVGLFGIVTDSEPSFGVLASTTRGNEVPPSVESVIFTLAQVTGAPVVPATFHVTVCREPPLHDTPVLGDVTWKGPEVLVTVTVISVNCV